MKSIGVYDQAFATIKSTTGISEIEEIVKIFVQLEERNYSLMTYTNQLNRDIEEIELKSARVGNLLTSRSSNQQQFEADRETAVRDVQSKIRSLATAQEVDDLEVRHLEPVLLTTNYK